MLAKAIVRQRIVDPRAQLWMMFQEIAYARRIAIAHRHFQRLSRAERLGLNVRLQLRPGGETVFVGQRMLRIRQFTLPHTAQQFFGLLLEKFEIRFFR